MMVDLCIGQAILTSEWTSTYAGHFLTEARPECVFQKMYCHVGYSFKPSWRTTGVELYRFKTTTVFL